MPTPNEIMEAVYKQAQKESLQKLLSGLSNESIQDLRVVAENAEIQKAVLGVTLTSLVYKVYDPEQDIRKHQDGMKDGYSGRTFDTKYVTPFLKSKFPHFAMAESAWLTRSLEQPQPFTLDFPGKIRNTVLKTAFLNTLDRIQTDGKLARKFLVALMGFMLEATAKDAALFTKAQVASGVTNVDNSCFESVEIKHNKPITADMVDVAYRKIRSTAIDRYYILTTSESNFSHYESVMKEWEFCAIYKHYPSPSIIAHVSCRWLLVFAYSLLNIEVI